MKIFNSSDSNFINDLKFFLNSRYSYDNEKIDLEVKTIIKEIVEKGDQGLINLSKKFDDFELNTGNFLIPHNIRTQYYNDIDKKILESFKIAISNVTNFHTKQLPRNYEIAEQDIIKGCVWKPIESVGLYVPGGSALYPSSLIMNVVPAKVANVKRIVVTTPSQKVKFDPYFLALLDLLEIKEVYQIGGAQAIAALAYGTQTIPSVNKIFGPGNAYVASAKKQLFGKVGIDLIAGPSEIVVVADQHNNPEWVASDLIAQAEHDERAQSILITDNNDFASKVLSYLDELMAKLPRKNIIKKSLENFGAIIILDNLDNAPKIIDLISPEHLHLQNRTYDKVYKKVNNAGGIFLGEYTAEAYGDYIVGTNHILPTFGSAKFSSGLGVIDFMKRTTYVQMNQISASKLGDHVSQMASIENLEGHKLSVKVRQTQKK